MSSCGLCFSAVLILSGCCFSLLPVRGHVVCNERKFITRISLTTSLESEILLPCLFDPVLYKFNVSTDSGAVWTYDNPAADTVAVGLRDIVDIKVKDHPSFWNNRQGRIKAFREGPAFGNFSILISAVQSSDLGLYRCELYRETNCSLAYEEISLSLAEVSLLSNWWISNWWLLAAGGGFLLLCLIAVCVYCTRTKRQINKTEVDGDSQNCLDIKEQTVELTYASVVHKPRSCNDSEGQANDEVTYASVAHKPRSSSHSEVASKSVVNDSESNPVSSETVVYGTVKQKDRR